jgi:rubredoxin
MFISQGNLSRKVVWVEGESFEGWGCSECTWVFNPSGPPVGESIDEMTQNFEVQLSEEFASHDCVHVTRQRA